MALMLQDFSFTLPASLIAQAPLTKRDESKLLVCQDGLIQHRTFHELPGLLPANSLLVANDTKVFPARLLGQTKKGGKAELLLTAIPSGDPATASALARPRKKLLRDGGMYLLDGTELTVSAAANGDSETVQVHFSCNATQAMDLLDKTGIMPLPPYIKSDPDSQASDAKSNDRDRQRYQTVFHQEVGSVAAPTAGLHFTRELLTNLEAAGHEICHLTLHVGLGTFAPIRVDDPRAHVMHEEFYKIPSATLTRLAEARKIQRPIFFVGTTSFRAVESYFLEHLSDQAAFAAADQWQSTKLFVFPKSHEDIYRPQLGSGIITNFHLPESSLYMLISALIGLNQAIKVYEVAIGKGYRFFSYGDANLLYFPRPQ